MIESLDEQSLQQLAQINRVFGEAVERQITPHAKCECIKQPIKQYDNAF